MELKYLHNNGQNCKGLYFHDLMNLSILLVLENTELWETVFFFNLI